MELVEIYQLMRKIGTNTLIDILVFLSENILEKQYRIKMLSYNFS